MISSKIPFRWMRMGGALRRSLANINAKPGTQLQARLCRGCSLQLTAFKAARSNQP
jgi:hypothetical protein